MEIIEEGKYEAATAVKLEDGRWCLFLDYYGVPGAGQGYVPFVADSLASGNFISDAAFFVPHMVLNTEPFLKFPWRSISVLKTMTGQIRAGSKQYNE